MYTAWLVQSYTFEVEDCNMLKNVVGDSLARAMVEWSAGPLPFPVHIASAS
jgi:hypothetical protein